MEGEVTVAAELGVRQAASVEVVEQGIPARWWDGPEAWCALPDEAAGAGRGIIAGGHTGPSRVKKRRWR